MNKAQLIESKNVKGLFLWKHPVEDFTNLSQLIVDESQEAILYKDGQSLDLFGPGKYTLDTNTIPGLTKYINRNATENIFKSKIYFANKTEMMAIKWGTDSKVQYMEPTYFFPLEIGCSGEMSLRLEDFRKLLIKIVGTDNEITVETITKYFRSILMTKVKTYIATFMREKNVSIFQIDEHLTTFSNYLKEALYDDFMDYGVSLERFYVTNVVKPDGEREYERFKALYMNRSIGIEEAKLQQQLDLIKAQTEAQKVVIDSQAQATKRAQEGYTYQQERGFDVAEKVANNEAVGQFTNMGVGFGTMAGVGGAVGGIVGGAINNAFNSANQNQAIEQNLNVCSKCGKSLVPGAKFCMECGTPVENKCPNCGKELPSSTKFCPECGTKLF